MINFVVKRVAFFLFLCTTCFGQGIDELKKQLSAASDSNKAGILNVLSETSLNKNASESLEYATQALDFAKKFGDVNKMAQAYVNLGNAHSKKAKYKEAIDKYQEALAIYKKYKSKEGEAYMNEVTGSQYNKLGKSKAALAQFINALKLYKEIKSQSDAGYMYLKIGDTYYKTEDYKKAIYNYKKGLEIMEGLNDTKNEAGILNKIGATYANRGDYNSALQYLLKSKEKATKAGLTNLLKSVNENIQVVNENMQDKERSVTEFEIEKAAEAEAYVQKIQEENEQSLEEIEKLSAEKQLVALKLKVKEAEISRKDLINKHALDKKDKALELKKAELAQKDAEEQRTEAIMYGLASIGCLFATLVVVVYRAYKGKQRDNRLLADQKEEIELHRDELHRVNHQMAESIDYAEHIQSAILPLPEEIAEGFANHFVFFKPRDVVSGDFYWYFKTNDKVCIAAVDCTGHGVPGAFLSFIGYNLLNQIVKNQMVTDPGKVLGLLSSGIKETLKLTGDEYEISDGMDIAFCTVDQSRFKLLYAGAKNPIYVVSSGELKEYRADRKSVGYLSATHGDFSTKEIDLNSGDTIYLFSDGFADQRGGPQGKKFYYEPFKELVQRISSMPLKSQQSELKNIIEEWQGPREQIDDMLIIGAQV